MIKDLSPLTAFYSSGGQKIRAAFTEIQGASIVLLDEPSNHLDLDEVEALIQGLVLFQGGILMVIHDEHLMSGSVDKIWVISQGKVAPFHGNFQAHKKILQFSLNQGSLALVINQD
ncbi:ABC transporter F family member 3-like [Eucalyptus grandis]|uniref:ABC transporter F family member 3-like n=1 Tax=Eucalyptus grandis TaxID=71139 RepID=UPI00192EC862|nr:ABC transporter F family member 3-like [Eucalyptus grandis]